MSLFEISNCQLNKCSLTTRMNSVTSIESYLILNSVLSTFIVKGSKFRVRSANSVSSVCKIYLYVVRGEYIGYVWSNFDSFFVVAILI